MIPILPTTPFGYTLFCDDIRQEVNGKSTLVGVYGNDLIIYGSLPATLPKLALWVSYFERLGESREPLELLVYLPGDGDDAPTMRNSIAGETLERIRSPNISSDVTPEDQLFGMTAQIILSPITLKEEGPIKVRMIRGENEIRLGTLHIRAQPRPTAQTD